jgi:hypothetical protein
MANNQNQTVSIRIETDRNEDETALLLRNFLQLNFSKAKFDVTGRKKTVKGEI